jgi:uncharacterized membrane protein
VIGCFLERAGRGPISTAFARRAVYGLAIFVVLMLVGRLIGQGFVAFDRMMGRVLPHWVAFTATVLLFAVVLVTVTRDFVVNPVFDAVNSAYGTIDDSTEAGVHQPTSDLVTGGPHSLVPWDTLGVQGRTYTGGTTTPAQLVEPGTPVQQPIRVCVGLQSADSAQARAKLAVKELERTGAFQRRVLVVGTATGTGWINPRSARAVEAINAAFVTMQYS